MLIIREQKLGRHDGVTTYDLPETDPSTSILDWKETIKELLRSENLL